MPVLTRKLLRDLMRLWPQALAIALVMAAGVSTMILAEGAYASLYETRAAYYERNRFADVFSRVTRAPKTLEAELSTIDGVGLVETRILKLALIDVEGMPEPAAAYLISLPDIRDQLLNKLYLRQGRMPLPDSDNEALVNEAFAKAHGFNIGDSFEALMNGTKRKLRIVGMALSPEYIYVLGPWDLMPDDRRFGIVWMSEKTLAAAYDLEGAFSEVSLSLLRDASEAEVIDRVDNLLKPYGSQGAYGRKDHTSHAFIDAELKQLRAMARVLPPIFLLVAAFLVNMILSRLVALEREQIGLLKAVGYGNFAVGLHYLQFVGVIAIVGSLIGIAVGTWFGVGLTRLYGDYFHFPFLLFEKNPADYVTAVAITLAAASVGAVKAVLGVVRLSPAVAMAPPAPSRYKRLLTWPEKWRALLPQTVVMITRHLLRWPLRTGSTILGIALGVSILVASLWSIPSIEFMIDVTFYQTERQDGSIVFVGTRRISSLYEIARLPGVMTAEPYRSLAVKIRNGPIERRIAITGKPQTSDLSRILDSNFEPVRLPEEGVAISDKLADILGVRTGDIVEIELMEGPRQTAKVAVTAVIPSFIGLAAYMNLDAVNALAREGALINGVNITFDEKVENDLYAALSDIPSASFIALQKISILKFRETMAQNILIMVSVYIGFASVIAFGVVYNAARISLSERGRELASLRVLGFTRGEVSAILLYELALLTLIAQPLGWAIGYGFAYAMVKGFESELYRIPFVFGSETYAIASLAVLTAAAISALVVRRRIDRLDLIEVLKTRE